MKAIIIIPARGGSKRLPRKNILPLAGEPLILHTISYAEKECPDFPIVVSTDDKEIKKISEDAGVVVIDRPEDLAGDFVTSASVMKHAVAHLMENGYEFDFVILLQVTNPLRPKGLVKEAMEIIQKGSFDSLFTVSRNDKKLGKIIDGQFIPWNYTYGMRSQDMEPLYYENGLLYITSKELLLNEIIEGPTAFPMVVDHPFGDVDIDTIDDFEYANYMLTHYDENK